MTVELNVGTLGFINGVEVTPVEGVHIGDGGGWTFRCEVDPVVGVGKGNDTITLECPDDFLGGVIEVHLVAVGGGGGGAVGDGFIAGPLELFNEVLVGELSETATFIGVEVDVINPDG